MESNLLSPPNAPVEISSRGSVDVLLVGNYPRDGQESMLRFSRVLVQELGDASCRPRLIYPRAYLGRWGKEMHRGVTKWLAYVDKFVIFPIVLWFCIRRMSREAADRFLVHICDHSNAPYTRVAGMVPVLVTCHDMLAVRGAMGEATDCQASRFGKVLQKWIVNGLSRAREIACVSQATRRDVERIVQLNPGSRVRLVPMGLNHRYRPLAENVIEERLDPLPIPHRPFVLHVGSNHPRKNRDGVLRSFAKAAGRWGGSLVFAGLPLTPELRALASGLGISDRIVEIDGPDNDVLEALYNRAIALLFLSRFEGFGWPIIEAQACGCPVICSNSEPLPEVAGEGAWFFRTDDEEGVAEGMLRLLDPAHRAALVRKGFANVERFSAERMITGYRAIYQQMTAVQVSEVA